MRLGILILKPPFSMREGPIVKKSLEFSLVIISYCDFLNSRRKFIIANQLLKAGTSIGANVFEASIRKVEWISSIK
jgi:hypothetical protein